MTREACEITRDDIMDMGEYAAVRVERRKAVTQMKKNRRVHIGPDATAYFENYETMWHQIHEMLHIEQGGEEQIADELRAYNPLIPKGRELVCTLMFEIDDEDRRNRFLAGLGGVEKTISLSVGGDKIMAVPEDDVERTSEEGKASSIQFLHFPFTDAQAEAFKVAGTDVVFAVGHDGYGHMAKLPEAAREALAGDLA
ncbi:DUF3501 family protein [Magnetovibrio sp. PR-2]|uniref:DUF3501 family protein n=1 Tax=Magnetovibrio sp. PR-2 TaxID=3120356 RepID=UPI002FCE0894